MRKKKYIFIFCRSRGCGRPWTWRVLARHRYTEGDGVICVSRTADSGERGLRVRNRV